MEKYFQEISNGIKKITEYIVIKFSRKFERCKANKLQTKLSICLLIISLVLDYSLESKL